jgi:dihydrofolate reductase
MAKLIYSMIASLDGYTVDADGNFDWAAPDEDVHAFVNDLERPIGTYLYGRRMYQTMVPWESPEMLANPSPVIRDFAQIWQAADKVVYSTTLDSPASSRTCIQPTFDADKVRAMKAASDRNLSVGGPHLAAQALRASLVDECRLFLVPVVVGGGTRALPEGVRLRLELLDERRFASGVVYLNYSVGRPAD